MAVEKISISLEGALARRVRRQARRERTSVSAIAARALENEERLAGLRRLVEEHEAEHGVIAREEVDRARELLWPD